MQSTTTVVTSQALSADNNWPADLSNPHREMLKASGISPEVARARGYRTLKDAVSDKTELQIKWKFDHKQVRPGLLVPIHNVRGEVTLAALRPDKPRSLRLKYETPKRQSLQVDVPPSIRKNLRDPSIPLLITEGSKKADSAVSRGLTSIALLGVWGWRGTNPFGGKTALPDWEEIAFNGRKVYVVFDSDVVVKSLVRKALARLRGLLAQRGAMVLIAVLPGGPNGEKVGMDDFFVAGRTPEDLFVHAQPEIPGEEAKPDDSAAAIAGDIALMRRFARDSGQGLFLFDQGVYVPGGDLRVCEAVKRWYIAKQIEDHWSTRKSEEVVGYLTADAPYLWEAPPLDRINVRNGLLDWKAGKLLDHNSAYLSPIQLPVTFDPGARCPHWEKFVEEVFPEDSRPLAWEIAAWLMVPFTGLQKAVLLLGSGGNGKSAFLRAVTAFIGRRNISTETLHRLEDNRFALASLTGRLANICADLPGEDLQSTSMFKSLVGGDTLTAERKFKPAFELVPYARLVFSANRPPRSKDGSDAFYQRWVVLRFERTFRGTAEEVRPNVLDAALAEPGELSGVLNKAIAVLPNLLEKGFTISESMAAAQRLFRQTTDPLQVWLEANVLRDPAALVPKEDLKTAYNKAAMKEGWPIENDTSFSLRLKDWMPGIRNARRTWSGTVKHCWTGIGLRSTREQAERRQESWR